MRTRRLVSALLVVGAVGLGVWAIAGSGAPPDADDAIAPGYFVRVAAERLPLFAAIGGEELGVATKGEQLLVVAGPRSAGELLWYHVETFSRNGSAPYALAKFGWIALPAGEVLVARYSPECPASDGQVEIVELASLSPAEALHCFGSRSISLAPIIARRESQDVIVDGRPEWLALEPELQLYGRHGWDSNDGSLGAHVVPPGVDPPLEAWLKVTGHFDSEASPECVRVPLHRAAGPISADDARLWCRQQFVIDHFEAAQAPDPTLAPPEMGGAWSLLPSAPIAPRRDHSGVWTGTEMIIWGGTILESEDPGRVVFAEVNDGAAFDPSAGRWRTIARASMPGRSQHVALWTGTEMLVWGGYAADGTTLLAGARYDPQTDGWREIPAAPLPALSAGSAGQAIWDGVRMVAWAGVEVASYDPRSNTWQRLPDIPARSPDGVSLAGGDGHLFGLAFPLGASALAQAFTLTEDAAGWRELPQPPLRALDADRNPIWTGEHLLAVSYSGFDGLGGLVPRDTMYAARFDPEAGAWTADLSPRYFNPYPHLWTGESVYFLWGFGVFHESTREWVSIPEMRELLNEAFAAVWTGESLLIWGGGRGESFRPLGDGWAFTPQSE